MGAPYLVSIKENYLLPLVVSTSVCQLHFKQGHQLSVTCYVSEAPFSTLLCKGSREESCDPVHNAFMAHDEKRPGSDQNSHWLEAQLELLCLAEAMNVDVVVMLHMFYQSSSLWCLGFSFRSCAVTPLKTKQLSVIRDVYRLHQTWWMYYMLALLTADTERGVVAVMSRYRFTFIRSEKMQDIVREHKIILGKKNKLCLNLIKKLCLSCVVL